MKIATLTETKNNLSSLIDQVRGGETIVILDRGRPVARLEPVLGDTPDLDGRLARLERKGVLRRSVAPQPLDLLRQRPAAPAAGASAVAALLAERDESR